MRTAIALGILLASAQAWAGEKMPFHLDRIPPTFSRSPPPGNFYVVRVCPGEKAPILRNLVIASDEEFAKLCAEQQQ